MPEYIYVLRTGMCKVIKAPDAIASLELRLKEVRFELLRITLSDVYHRTLRPTATTPFSLTPREAADIAELAELNGRVSPDATAVDSATLLVAERPSTGAPLRPHSAGGSVHKVVTAP